MPSTPQLDLVIVGLGYVGLPLARAATLSGLRVVGLDRNEAVVHSIELGLSPVDDVSDADLITMRQRGFTATLDPSCLAVSSSIVICVPTPLDQNDTPDLDAVISAVEVISSRLNRGSLVVLESTTYPGTTQDVVRPMLERSGLKVGQDFFLAYSPERIDPGNRTYSIENTPKIVGGVTAQCTEAAVSLYSHFVREVVAAKTPREAEMAKLLENTYRQVNIALVNEMAMFCKEIDVDLWDAIRCAATKPFGFEAFHPGPGVGGHCIPIDPSYLSYKVKSLGFPFRFVELAHEINRRMPVYVGDRVGDLLNDMALPICGSRILLLGVTYKANVSDQRESPAIAVATHLLARGADLHFHDPRVREWTVAGLEVPFESDYLAGAREADLVVLLQAHESLALDQLVADAKNVLDTRGACPPSLNVTKL